MNPINSPVDTEPAAAPANPATELLTHPLWQAGDVGKPIPHSPHAASVAMPLWEHVVRYEERDQSLLEKLQCGYPRFVFNATVNELFQLCRRRFAGHDELCLAFPSLRVAERCVRFLREMHGFHARVTPLGLNGVHVVTIPAEAFDAGKKYWQHYGEIISSRQAQATLEERGPAVGGDHAKKTVRDRIAALTGARADDVYLYASGMAALSGALDIVRAARPGAKTAQVGLPYVDLLRIQTKWGPQGLFYSDLEGDRFESLRWEVANGPIAGVFCEHPGNPLLRSHDLEALSALLREHGVPLVVDETLGSYRNVNVLPFADIVVTSLTKYFSGVGDVMAGALVLNAESPLYATLKHQQNTIFEDLLWDDDAGVLERNSRDFEARMTHINRNAETVFDHLANHPKVDRVHFPKCETPELYRRTCKPGAGYGGMFSLVLKDAARKAPAFYDALRVSKGPSLGTNFTLACPYTLLAHYDELDWVESLGVSPYLVRVSIGLEDPGDLIERFETALRRV